MKMMISQTRRCVCKLSIQPQSCPVTSRKVFEDVSRCWSNFPKSFQGVMTGPKKVFEIIFEDVLMIHEKVFEVLEKMSS